MFMIAVGSAVGTAAGAGAVSARSSPELNADSDLAPIPRVETTVDIEGVEIGSDPLAFTEDDGTDTSLEAYGGEVAPIPTDADGNDQPHNPFSLRADYIDSDEYGAFPRDRTDSNDDPISGLDASFWSTTAAEASVSDTTPASGGEGVHLSTSGVASGSEAGIEFTEVDITDGVSRKELQVVLSVASFSGTVEVRVGDGSTWATAVVDSAANSDDVGTIATSTGDGIVFQAQVGDLNSSVSQISTIQVVAVDGDAELEIAALNVEKESPWSFGDKEVLGTDDDGNDEIQTEEWVEPSGTFAINSLGTLDDVFSGGSINPVTVDVEYFPIETDKTTTDPENPAYDKKLELMQNIEIPSAYDLSHGALDVYLEVGPSPDQWSTLEVATGLSETLVLDDQDEESFTDYSGGLSSVSTGDDVTLGTTSSGSTLAVHQSLDVTSDQLEEIESGAVTGYFGSGGGGFFSTPTGVIATVGSGLMAYVAIARGWLARLVGA
jgi:hypothetical protein